MSPYRTAEPLRLQARRVGDIELVCQHTTLPVLLGSGATPDNLPNVYAKVDGLIVGSYCKQGGQAENFVEEARVKAFTETMQALDATLGSALYT